MDNSGPKTSRTFRNSALFREDNITGWNELSDDEKKIRARRIAYVAHSRLHSPEGKNKGIEDCLKYYVNYRTFGEVANEIVDLAMDIIRTETEEFDVRRNLDEDDDQHHEITDLEQRKRFFAELERTKSVYGRES